MPKAGATVWRRRVLSSERALCRWYPYCSLAEPIQLRSRRGCSGGATGRRAVVFVSPLPWFSSARRRVAADAPPL